MKNDQDFIIIGSGFGGQCTAINLLRRGLTDFVILERRSFMGGTWKQNTYPGAAVDVPSPLYSLSSEPFPWTQMFAEQAELGEYTDHVIDKHGLRDKTVLGANVLGATWDEDSHTWEVSTESSGTFRARFLINATGPLSTPVIPAFPGKGRFRGKAFHTNDWDHSFDHTGKRVAIVGSGASAAQVIPAIADQVEHLHVFQRTPHWILPRPDRRFSRRARGALRLSAAYQALRKAIYWQLETRVIGFKYSITLLNAVTRKQALKLLEEQVSDPELRAELTPEYDVGCKRIILSSTLYPALSRDNVTVHTRDSAIEEVTEKGILTTDGEHLDLDLIIWSTGYDATDGLINYPVTGRNGTTLAERWAEYPRAYLGTTVPEFPNMFILGGPNTAIGHTSAIFMLEAQVQYVMRLLGQVTRRGSHSVEVTAEAEAAYTSMIHREMSRTVWKRGGCTSWYQSRSGHVTVPFPGFTFTYRQKAKAYKPQHHEFTS